MFEYALPEARGVRFLLTSRGWLHNVGAMVNMDIWLILGLVAQAMFFGRFFVQWIVSEYKGESTVPVAFWFFSVGGGGLLLIYAIHRRDPVFILGQAGGLVIYLRNLMLIYRKKKIKQTQPDAEMSQRSVDV
jgi:lipid-A-disaccharide synthase-like uncharacterized protein